MCLPVYKISTDNTYVCGGWGSHSSDKDVTLKMEAAGSSKIIGNDLTDHKASHLRRQ